MLKHKQRVSKACAKEETWVHNIQKYWPYYLMVLPGLLFFVIFKFIPMFGIIITTASKSRTPVIARRNSRSRRDSLIPILP